MERRENQHLLLVDVECVRQLGALAVGDGRDGAVAVGDFRRCTKALQLGHHVGPVAQHRVLVRRSQRHRASPRLAAGPVDVGAVLGEEPDERRPPPAPDGVGDQEAFVRVRAGLEQEPDVLLALVVERMRERVRPSRRRPVLEQEPQALGALGLSRVVDGLVVVRIGAVLEQQPRRLRVVDDAGGAVQRGHRAVLVRVRRVRVRAALEQLADETAGREHGLAGVVERRPAARAARRVRIAGPAAPEDERGPRVVRELGQRLEHRLRPPAPSVRRGQHEGVGAGLGRCDESRPAGVALLPRDTSCARARNGSRPPAARAPPARRRARRGRAPSPASKLIEIHDDLPPRGPCPRVGRRRDRCVAKRWTRWALPCPRTGGALGALRCYTRSPPAPARAPGPAWRAPSRRGRAQSRRSSPR